MKVLYTAYVSVLEKVKRKVKVHYLIRDCGNDAVVPDQADLDQFRNGVLTWQGFKVSYLAKLMKPEAEEWMKRVSDEAASKDVVLVDEEKNVEHCHRILLAEMMMNMFSGKIKLRYMGELKV